MHTHGHTHQFLSLSRISCVYMYIYVFMYVSLFCCLFLVCNSYYVNRSRGNEKASRLPSKEKKNAINSPVAEERIYHRHCVTITTKEKKNCTSRGRKCERFVGKYNETFRTSRKSQFNPQVVNADGSAARKKNEPSINQNSPVANGREARQRRRFSFPPTPRKRRYNRS